MNDEIWIRMAAIFGEVRHQAVVAAVGAAIFTHSAAPVAATAPAACAGAFAACALASALFGRLRDERGR
eukprot:5277301-Pleurochrysis_carterae.AAC.1